MSSSNGELCWVFTWNNYDNRQMSHLLSLTEKDCKILVFGEEMSQKGTPHLQGYVKFNSVKRAVGCKKFLDPIDGKHSSVHVAASMAKNMREAYYYCMKGEQSHEEWQEFGTLGPNYGKNARVHVVVGIPPSNQGKRTDWEDLFQYCRTHTKLEVINAYPEMYARYHAAIDKAIAMYEVDQQWDNIHQKYSGWILRPWQSKLIEILKGRVHDRKVIWYCDKVGGTGKSEMSGIITSMFPRGTVLTLENCKTADAACVYSGQRIVIFDFAREQNPQNINYVMIENLKNGKIFSSKYNSVSKQYTRPHVVCFANTWHTSGALSKDKWHNIKLTELDTVGGYKPDQEDLDWGENCSVSDDDCSLQF